MLQEFLRYVLNLPLAKIESLFNYIKILLPITRIEKIMSEINKSKKTKTGSVVSDRMEKSIVVQVERKIKHALYGKFVKKTVKYLADDPENLCKIGDLVLIEECRPLSKRKRWRLRTILERSV
jgi:small subunit ribosomal protein S17